MKIKLKYDKIEDRWDGLRLHFKENEDGSFSIINHDEELLGHLEKLRCGKWMHWCLLLEEGCYLSPGCNDEVREMQRMLGSNKKENKNVRK